MECYSRDKELYVTLKIAIYVGPETFYLLYNTPHGTFYTNAPLIYWDGNYRQVFTGYGLQYNYYPYGEITDLVIYLTPYSAANQALFYDLTHNNERFWNITSMSKLFGARSVIGFTFAVESPGWCDCWWTCYEAGY